ncbi:MAG: preprotein translocase subunit YajC [Eubacterium sp.]|nr:preprotein translocase subunit YajC [Eubacterium sp.]
MSQLGLSGGAAAGKGQAGSATSSIIMMVGLVAVMYFLMIRPQKKRQKEEQEMRSSLEIGDEIITIGGIVGKVIKIREEDIVIETGADKTKMRLQRWAVNTNVTKTEQHRKEVEAARESAKDKKLAKKNKESESSTSAKEVEKNIEK